MNSENDLDRAVTDSSMGCYVWQDNEMRVDG